MSEGSKKRKKVGFALVTVSLAKKSTTTIITFHSAIPRENFKLTAMYNITYIKKETMYIWWSLYAPGSSSHARLELT